MREIAAEIFVSTNTVNTHVKRIYIKLGVSSRMEARAGVSADNRTSVRIRCSAAIQRTRR
jgi:DNA-binding NarL/FixJ family response regulator